VLVALAGRNPAFCGGQYVEYENGFVLPVGANVDPNSLSAIGDFILKGKGKVFHRSLGGVWEVTGLSLYGARVKISKKTIRISGFAVYLGNGGVEYVSAFTDDQASSVAIRRTREGAGVLALTIAGSEWLLPYFDLSRAATNQRYVYKGPFVEVKK